MSDKRQPAKVSQPKNLKKVKAHVMKAEGASFKTSKDIKLRAKPEVYSGPLGAEIPSIDANTDFVEGAPEFGEYHSLLAKDYIVHSKEIEYKSVDRDTFEKDGYKVVFEKVVPDKEGFVKSDLLSKINLEESNTVVIMWLLVVVKQQLYMKLLKKLLKEMTKEL